MSSNELIKNEELILTALAGGSELYGLKIVKLIEDASDGEIIINYGSLYPLLNKLTKKGYVESYWEDENARKGARRRYYQITEKGIALVNQSELLRKRLKQLASKTDIDISSPEVFEFEVVKVNNQGKIVTRETKQAKYFTEQLPNDVTLDMVYIPGGSFMMGSPEGENYQDKSYREGREFPQHQVTVSDFYMAKYPITQEQWEAIASLPGIEPELNLKPSHFQEKNRPVERITWNDAQEFCQRLSQYTKKEYRLPSEAEWEYGCRAGTTTPFYCGETITGELANYNARETFANESKGLYRRKTTEVGMFPANAFGLYDMHGNVWEYCEDAWHDNYQGAPNDGRAWINDNDNLYIVLRGGSWLYDPNRCRSAYRSYDPRDNRYDHFGFRVVGVAPRTF